MSSESLVVVITGASSGIGKALALEYLHRGAKISLAARKLDALEAIKNKFPDRGGDILVTQCDVTSEGDCRNLMTQTIAAFGQIDILINNAGISMRALFEDVDLEVIREVMDVNFWGTVYCTKYALPFILQRKGSVAGVSSVAGFKGLPGRTAYSASKFAMEGFLETLRIENRKKGLHVLVACPGYTTSNIRNVALDKDGKQQGESPLKEDKLMSAEEVASRIATAIDKRKRKIIMGREGVMVYWLNKFFPAWLDGMVYKTVAREPNSPFQ
jgi:short-subunit dehydrogenase